MDRKDTARINSLVKAFDALELLSQKPEWELAELCQRLAMPKTTVHRVITTLEDLGYVSQEKKRGGYALTSKLFQLGSRVINHSGLVDLARPLCHRLMVEVDETVNLCIPHGTDMLVLDIQVADHPLKQDTRVGVGFAMIRSASGRAYLGSLAEPELTEFLEKIRHQEKVSPGRWQELVQELDIVRNTGVGYDNEEIFTGVRCVAAPIFDHNGQVVATISISAPVMRLNEKILADAAVSVSRTAEAVSNRLGAPPRRQQL